MINEKEILEYVDSKIKCILEYPKMYGTCKEAIELQIISHLEFKYIFLYGSSNSRSILELYQKEILNLYPDTNTYLFALTKNMDDFMDKLKYVVNEVRKKAKLENKS